MKTTLKILLELVTVFVLTYMLSLQHIFIANVYNIPLLSWFFVLLYFLCIWLCHKGCGMHRVRLGSVVTTIVCAVTLLAVESLLRKDEKGCRDWILEVVECISKKRINDGGRSLPCKERSFNIAMDILRNQSDNDVFRKIKACEDVDALRIIAFTASTTAWPMEAGPDVGFDDMMEGIFYVAMQKLFEIDSDEATESIECYKRAFPPDGALSLFFKECEEKRRALHSKQNGKEKESKSAIISPERHLR